LPPLLLPGPSRGTRVAPGWSEGLLPDGTF